MKKANLTNLWVQGLLMAAVIAAAAPISGDAFAQLSSSVTASRDSVFTPVLQLLSFACYVIGGVLVIGGVMKFKHHAENPTQGSMSHGFARTGAGAALLAMPSLMHVLNSTANNTLQGSGGLSTFTF